MTDHIDRREWIHRVALASGALALPAWLVSGLRLQDPTKPKSGGVDGDDGDDSIADPSDPKQRMDALRRLDARARRLGKPILVCVIPESTTDSWPRGMELGAFLNHCGPHTLLDLATCEPSCATVAELREVFPGIAVEGEPLMVRFVRDRNDDKPRTDAIVPDYSKLPPEPTPEPNEYEAYKKALLAFTERRIACVELAVRASIAQMRALAVAPESLDEAKQSTIAAIAGSDDPADPDFVFDHATYVFAAMNRETNRTRRGRFVAALVAAGTKHFRTDRVPGSKWALSGGCGLEFEGEKSGDAGMACGMAMTPPLSSRFLYLYTKS